MKKGIKLEIYITNTSDYYIPPYRNIENGKFTFEVLNDPVKWCNFTFRWIPKANKQNKYNSFPTYETPVSKTIADGIKVVYSWVMFLMDRKQIKIEVDKPQKINFKQIKRLSWYRYYF